MLAGIRVLLTACDITGIVIGPDKGLAQPPGFFWGADFYCETDTRPSPYNHFVN